QIRAEVGARRHAHRLRRARVGDLDERARTRVALTEEEEIVRGVARQDGEVRLHEARGEAGGDAGEGAAADVRPDVSRVARVDRHESPPTSGGRAGARG